MTTKTGSDRCPKCGDRYIKTEYKSLNLQEWLSKLCQKCGYHWNVDTEDNAKK